jgi:folate-binding protein YgfZ
MLPNQQAVREKYQAAIARGGYLLRDDRSLLEVTGRDRATWLNNLITNVVKTLQPGEGNYAFATNVQGRVVVDLNVLVLDDRLWLDVDRRWADTAIKHFNKYIITEDAAIADVTASLVRFGAVGPLADELTDRLGLGHIMTRASLQHFEAEVLGTKVRVLRHDWLGLVGVEFIVPVGTDAVSQLSAACKSLEMVRLDAATCEVLRVEAGLPKSVDDIDGDVVPPETMQVERGISYHKGCYLGQEVIERMRSHGVLARRLVGIRLEGDAMAAPQSVVMVGDGAVGRVTSGCWSEALNAALCLGYVKTAHSRPETAVEVDAGGSRIGGQIVALPARP